MDTDEDMQWLGEDMIQQNGERITVPSEVVEAGIVEPGNSVFWAADDDGVVLSKRRDVFDAGNQFQLLGETTLMGNREVMLPSEVSERVGVDAGDILHFATANSLRSEHVCRVMTEDVSERV